MPGCASWKDADSEKIGVAVLHGDDPPGGEGPPVAHPVDVVDDRDVGVAGADEVGVQRVHGPVRLDRAAGGDQRLPGHLAAEHPLPGRLRADSAEDVLLDLLEVEQPDQTVDDGLAERGVEVR